MHLADDIKKVEAGWSPKSFIIDRASCMRSHAAAGNHQRAEEYAYEISRLQEAYDARMGFAPAAPFPDGCEEWVLSPERWGWLLVSGHLSRRSFYPAIDSSIEEALAEAKRVNPMTLNSNELRITAADISILNDVRLYARVAAE